MGAKHWASSIFKWCNVNIELILLSNEWDMPRFEWMGLISVDVWLSKSSSFLINITHYTVLAVPTFSNFSLCSHTFIIYNIRDWNNFQMKLFPQNIYAGCFCIQIGWFRVSKYKKWLMCLISLVVKQTLPVTTYSSSMFYLFI